MCMVEQGDLLCEDNLVHRSCQVWSRQTYLWMVILHMKKIYCTDIENELKNYHNKAKWANSVLMQDSWPQWKSDSISWRKTMKNSRNSQVQWLVVSTLCQETKVYLNQKVGFERTPRLDPYWKLQLVAYKVNMQWKSESSLWAKTILTRGSEILMAWTSWSQTWTTRTKTTTSRKPQKCSSKTCVEIECTIFCKPIKGQSKTIKTRFCQLITKTIPIGERTWTDIEPQDYSSIDSPVSKHLITLLRHGSLPREDDGAIEFWRVKDYLQNHFVQSRHWSDEKWKSIMAKGGGNKKRSIRRNSLPPSSSRSFRTQSYWSYFTGQRINSGRFLQVHLSRWMCNQFTFHHQFRIYTGRSKFEQKTDNSLSSCESYG